MLDAERPERWPRSLSHTLKHGEQAQSVNITSTIITTLVIIIRSRVIVIPFVVSKRSVIIIIDDTRSQSILNGKRN